MFSALHKLGRAMKKDKPSILIETDQGNIFWLDVLRVFATVAVVFLHVSAEVVTGITDTKTFSWWAANLYDSAVRWAVPVFVMISGALLLGHSHKESFTQFYRKRSSRVIIPLVFWTAAYFAFISHYYGQIELKTALISIVLGKPYWHLWYLYMLVGLYIITPFLRTYVASSSIKERYALIIVIFTFAALNAALNYFVFNNIISDMQTVFTMFVPYVGYYICGQNKDNIHPFVVPCA
jgi:surface polysaccharide O-acyltransferase-like enzyme